MNCLASIRISENARPISGVIFEAARPAEELARIEARASAPDFWSNQAEAQKILQRRRRVEEDVELIARLGRITEDLGVLIEWAGQGENVLADLSTGLDEFARVVEAGEIKKMLGGEHDRKNAIV